LEGAPLPLRDLPGELLRGEPLLDEEILDVVVRLWLLPLSLEDTLRNLSGRFAGKSLNRHFLKLLFHYTTFSKFCEQIVGFIFFVQGLPQEIFDFI
jgi:hypothetical protein